MPIAYQFLPWVRRGLAVALDTEDNLGAGAPLPARGSAHVGVTLAGPHAATAITPVPMRLYGPGDVIGIDQRVVVRTDPKPHATNFEPNYLAIVDFDPPDFPWMLTPARAQDDRRLRPWLVLIVLDRAETGVPRISAGAPLPSIRIKAQDVASELPDLAESWSWAHAQLVNDDAAQIQADLQSKPASNVSRLVCPRRLKERTDYVACVVPAFEPGRLRGLGLVADERDAAMTTLAPAWSKNAAADVVLPVYYYWEFSTGPKGDFESLARRLRTPKSYANTPVEEQLKTVGTIPMSVDNLLSPTPGLVTTMEGALVPIGYDPGSPPRDDHALSLEVIVNTPQDQVVNPVGDGPDSATGKRLEVKPPLYGAWHAKKHQVYRAGTGPASAPKLGSHWLADLNLNPRYRAAAGYGAEVVRKKQEEYVDACWDQIGDILKAEMKFNLTRLAIEALTAIKRKHFDVLPPERLMQVFGPALPRIEALGTAAQTYRINGKIASLGGQLARSSMPVATVDPALRRVANPGHRSLRMAARLAGSAAALPAIVNGYVRTMAAASTKAAPFAVNAFTPDGIVGTRLFDKLDLVGPDTRSIDLAAIGLKGAKFTVGEIRRALASAQTAQRVLETRGVPDLKIRTGQQFGVFTDLHVDRFGMLVSKTPAVRPSDWGIVSTHIETLGRRGIEGFLVEVHQASTLLRVHAMRLDSRGGQLTVDQTVAQFDGTRHSLRRSAEQAALPRAVAGLKVGKVEVTPARKLPAPGLFAALPPNVFSTAENAPRRTLTLNPSLEFEEIELPGGVPDVVTITLPPAIRTREVLNRFAIATRGVQGTWRDAFAAKRVTVEVVDFPLAQAATIVRARTEPALTLPIRLASTVSIAQAAVNKADAHVAPFLPKKATIQHRFLIPKLFDRVMAWPHLRNAFYRDLVEYDKNAFMPGVDNLPQDLIMLVRVNQFFIDAVMVGANFEMNRELLWRGFPTDLRGTPFQRFWGRVQPGDSGALEELDDIEPIHQWRAQPLGLRTDENMPDPNRIALLVRGQLLRRYPNTAVYAWKKRITPPNPASGDHTMLMKDANGNPPDPSAIQAPVFSGFIPPDITFFGFEIDEDQADQWCFVLEEQMSEPRFGFDVDEVPADQPQGTTPPRRPALVSALKHLEANGSPPLAAGYNAYKALSWSHVQVAPGEFASVSKLVTVPGKPFASFPTLAPNATAADIAKALLQQPFRAYYLGADLRPPEES